MVLYKAQFLLGAIPNAQIISSLKVIFNISLYPSKEALAKNGVIIKYTGCPVK